MGFCSFQIRLMSMVVLSMRMRLVLALALVEVAANVYLSTCAFQALALPL